MGKFVENHPFGVEQKRIDHTRHLDQALGDRLLGDHILACPGADVARLSGRLGQFGAQSLHHGEHAETGSNVITHKLFAQPAVEAAHNGEFSAAVGEAYGYLVAGVL